jgi:hypothetical protein
MRHDATNDPHHAITLFEGDRLKAYRFTADLRAGDLYEVRGFDDRAFPENERSTTKLLNVTTGDKLSINTAAMQSAFRDGAWGLS